MKYDVLIFEHSEFGSIRGFKGENGEAWLMATDVARRLGYTNPQKAIRDHVDDEDKTLNESFTVNGTIPVLINESGLYSLIMSSKLPQAKEFKHWVTSDVLPTIRKHGAYMTDEAIEKALLNPDTVIQLATSLKEEREARLALQAKNADITVDCKDMAYTSSQGLRVFLMLQKSTMANGGKLVLTNMIPAVKEVFDITGFSSIIKIV